MNIREYLIRTAYENIEARGVILPLLSLKTASEETLVSRVIRLAYENPEMREYVLPYFDGDLFKEAGKKKKPGNKDKEKAKRKQKKEMKNRRREKDVKKKKNKARNPMGVAPENQAEFERDMANERFKLLGGAKADYAFSTVYGYAMDEAAKLHEDAKKVMADAIEKWNKSWAKKKLVEGGQKLAGAASEALEASKIVSDVAGEMIAEVGVIGQNLGSSLAESAEGDFAKTKDTFNATKTALDEKLGGMADKYSKEVQETVEKTLKKKGEELGENFSISSASEALGVAKKFLIRDISMATSKIVAGSKKKGAKAGAKAGAGVGATLKAAPRGLAGIAKGFGSAIISAAGKGAQALGQGMQNTSRDDIGKLASDNDDLKNQVIKYLSYVGAEDIEYVQKFIKDDVLDVDALNADLKKRSDSFEQALLKDLEEGMAEVEAEAKKEEKEVEKKEVKVIERELGEDAFVAKTAVVKLAYENPKYRPQLLQLLQVPRTHYALSDIRACLSR